jgi:regulator of sirC expression with transglutaminase-like and TPR domain
MPTNVVEVLAAAETDIEDVALAIASDAYPGLQVARYREALDDMAAPLATEFAAADDETKLEALTDHVYDTLGFCGNEREYYDPRNSYLNDVIDRRTGIPITLSIVLMALGRRIGLCVEGVGFPGHFIVRVGGPGGVFVDAFDRGHVLPRGRLEDNLARIMPQGEGLVEGQLEVVGPRVMAVRILFNLQKIYERRGDYPRALVVCDRLVDVTDVAFHRRDRGQHALALGAWSLAIDDLSSYLDATTDPPDAEHVEELLARARQHVQADTVRLRQ